MASYLYEFARDSEYERYHFGVGKKDVIWSSPDYGAILCMQSLGFFVDLAIPSHGNMMEPCQRCNAWSGHFSKRGAVRMVKSVQNIQQEQEAQETEQQTEAIFGQVLMKRGRKHLR